MAASRSSVKTLFRGLWSRVTLHLSEWLSNKWSRAISRFDKSTPAQRKSAAVIGSLLLHLGFLLLLLPSTTGISSIGTTGIGSIDGVGTVVTLIDASELTPPKASEAETLAPEESLASEPSSTEEAAETPDAEKKANQAKSEAEDHSQTKTETVQSDSDAPSDSTAQAAAGAHGQNGQTNIDLWNAIAPCWNRIADKNTLSATLTISFAEDGGLSVPPIIERDINAPITDRSLKSEALALQALAECGAYAMVKGQQNVRVVFPAQTKLLSAK